MADEVHDDEEERDEDEGQAIDNFNLDSVIAWGIESSKWKQSDVMIESGNVAWRPHLASTDGESVLHIHLVKELRSHWKERISIARQQGLTVVLALELRALYYGDIVEFLADVDAKVVLLKSDTTDFLKPIPILRLLCGESIPLSPATRRYVAQCAWSQRQCGTSNEKGDRFEDLIALLLEQTAGFRVIARKFHGHEDEIDIILKVDRWSDYCWVKPGAPYILVEAKNEANNIGPGVISKCYANLEVRNGSAFFAFVFSASNFTSGARDRARNLSSEDSFIVLFDQEQILEWIEHQNPDDFLEACVEKALLK